MNVEIRDAEHIDAFVFGPKLRQSDLDECYAGNGMIPSHALLSGIASSSLAKSVVVDGEPLLIFGVAPSPIPLMGIPWMVATDLLDNPKLRLQLARQSREMVEELHSEYDLLTNVVDARNEVHIRWLLWCGFSFLREVPVGPLSVPFYEFARIKRNV